MPARFLTAEQRRCYGTFPDKLSADALARHFHLDATDHIVIQDLRGLHNRLGFAVQLGTVRLLGRFPDRFTDLPLGVIRAAASQLGGDFSESARRAYEDGRQRWRHVAIITQRYGFRRFEDDGPARFRLTRWLYALCWTGEDRPIVLFDRAVPWLIANKVLLPGVTTLERLVGRICDRVERRQWRLLVGSLSPAQRRRIDQLFVPENPDALATLDTLRATPARRAPTELVRHLERLRGIKAFDLRPTPPTGIPAAVLERLARVARRSKPSAIAAIQQPRRTAIIVALFLSLEAMAQDDAAELADTLLADLFRTAEHERKAEQLVGLPRLEEAALVLHGMGEMVLSEDALPLTEWRAALFAKIPRDEIDAAMRHIAGLAKPRDQKPFAQLRARWRRARGIFSPVANGLVIDATPGGKPVWEAMRYLSQRTDWSKPMRDAPTAAITKPWRRHVLGADGKVSDPKAYVFAIMDGWRGALKRRDVFVEPGIRYGDPRRGLLDDKTWEASRAMVCRTLSRTLDADAELARLSQLLDAAFQKVANGVAENPDLRIETRDGKPEIVVTPLDRLEEPDSLRALRTAVQGMMPRADLPGVVLEIMRKTGFDKAFTHLSEREARVEDFGISLCAALIAQACNTGYEPMIRQDIAALRRSRIAWVDINFIRPETIAAASTRIVAAHSALPIVELWGEGDVASADGIRFAAPLSAIHAGPNPKYYGQGRGITWYNLVSDQFSGLGGIVVPGTLRDSLLILALLLDQQTDLQPAEIMTDTGAYSDTVFGLFWLLGYQFSPRLADLGGARLWRISPDARYGVLNAIARQTINLSLIRANWDDMLRLAGSLRLGHLQASGVMRTLQVKDRPTTLARALAELGRIIKTLHILRYVDDRPFRRRILTQLNRQELRHKLGRRVIHGERGEIRTPYRVEQQTLLSALDLVLNAITHWNGIYIQAAINKLRADGQPVEEANIARLSPLAWRHINFLGRYDFSVPEPVARGELRPLRDPNSEYDF
jgi:TnpA family transposase